MVFTQYVALVLDFHIISHELICGKVYFQEMQNGGLQLWSVERIKFNIFAFHAPLTGVSEDVELVMAKSNTKYKYVVWHWS